MVQCMVDSSEKGSADIIKSDSDRVFMTQRVLVGMQTVWSSILHLSTWLFVLSQYVSDINVGKINQCVVCGGGIGKRFRATLSSVESLSKTRLQVR